MMQPDDTTRWCNAIEIEMYKCHATQQFSDETVTRQCSNIIDATLEVFKNNFKIVSMPQQSLSPLFSPCLCWYHFLRRSCYTNAHLSRSSFFCIFLKIPTLLEKSGEGMQPKPLSQSCFSLFHFYYTNTMMPDFP